MMRNLVIEKFEVTVGADGTHTVIALCEYSDHIDYSISYTLLDQPIRRFVRHYNTFFELMLREVWMQWFMLDSSYSTEPRLQIS